MDKITLSTVLDLIKNKDEHGIELFYKNYYNLAYGIAFSISKNAEISEEVIQNTAFKLWNLNEEKFPKSNEKTWFYKVVKNETLMLLRHEKQTCTLDFIENLESKNNCIENFINMEEYYSLIKSLNQNQKEIVSLKVLGGLTHKEIAKILQKPIGTIQWQYNVAINKLKIVINSLVTLFVVLVATVLARIIYLLNFFKNPNPDLSATADFGGLKFYMFFRDNFFKINMQFLFVTAICLFVFLIVYYFSSKKLKYKLYK